MIKNADMSEDMQQDAVDCASQALEKYNIEKVRFIISSGTSCLNRTSYDVFYEDYHRMIHFL